MALRLSHLFQQTNERVEFRRLHVLKLASVKRSYGLIQLIRELHALLRDSGCHHAPIFRTPLASHQPHPFHPVHQASYVRIPRHHALSHLAAGKAGSAGSSQNPQHVVLSRGEAARLERLAHLLGKHTHCPEQVQISCFLDAAKRLSLPDLLL